MIRCPSELRNTSKVEWYGFAVAILWVMLSSLAQNVYCAEWPCVLPVFLPCVWVAVSWWSPQPTLLRSPSLWPPRPSPRPWPPPSPRVPWRSLDLGRLWVDHAGSISMAASPAQIILTPMATINFVSSVWQEQLWWMWKTSTPSRGLTCWRSMEWHLVGVLPVLLMESNQWEQSLGGLTMPRQWVVGIFVQLRPQQHQIHQPQPHPWQHHQIHLHQTLVSGSCLTSLTDRCSLKAIVLDPSLESGKLGLGSSCWAPFSLANISLPKVLWRAKGKKWTWLKYTTPSQPWADCGRAQVIFSCSLACWSILPNSLWSSCCCTSCSTQWGSVCALCPDQTNSSILNSDQCRCTLTWKLETSSNASQCWAGSSCCTALWRWLSMTRTIWRASQTNRSSFSALVHWPVQCCGLESIRFLRTSGSLSGSRTFKKSITSIPTTGHAFDCACQCWWTKSLHRRSWFCFQ